jgi:predicted RNase H-like HicB family nuclease
LFKFWLKSFNKLYLRAFAANRTQLGFWLKLLHELTVPMKAIKIIIEKTKDMYTAYAENTEGIYGGGDTIEEAKASIETSIKLYNKYNKLDPEAFSISYEIKDTS